jgi:hypothetical protein
MPVSREELQKRIDAFEAALPGLMKEHPDHEHFNPVCSAHLDEITDHAGPEDDAWAFAKIDAILEKHGLWRPGQADLPPDE